MLIALDPGITTGIATLSDYPTGPRELIASRQVKCSHLQLWKLLQIQEPTEIVYESFIYQRRNKVELYPVEVIGVIKLYAETYDIPLYVQSASQAKGFITNEKIKKIDLWEKGQVHGMDALRHLLYHLMITKGDKVWLNKLRPV